MRSMLNSRGEVNHLCAVLVRFPVCLFFCSSRYICFSELLFVSGDVYLGFYLSFQGFDNQNYSGQMADMNPFVTNNEMPSMISKLTSLQCECLFFGNFCAVVVAAVVVVFRMELFISVRVHSSVLTVMK